MPRPQEAQNIVDRVTSLDPGIYTADSNTDGYGSLTAAVALGSAQFLGECFLENGATSIAVEVGGPPENNPPDRKRAYVRIGANFYSKALLDYRPDWRPMWFREAIQNSVDAGRRHRPDGITRIDLDIEKLADGNVRVSCTDNGGGMTWDLFQSKFLALGETGKTSSGRYNYMTEMARTRAATEETEEGDAGGFGEAKRLLILPWIEIEIHSQDWMTKAQPSSEDPDKSAFDPMDAPFRLDGTRLSVTMPATNFCDEEHALRVIRRSFLPNVRFKVNGKAYKADLPLGREIIPFAATCQGKALLYHQERSRKLKVSSSGNLTDDEENNSVDGEKTEKEGEMIVRKRGIWMFSLPINKKIHGYLVLRLVAPSIDVLTASRMQLGDHTLIRAVNEQIFQLAVDPRSALRKEENKVWKPYKGSLGQVRADVREQNKNLEAVMRQQVGAADKIAEREGVAAVEEFIKKVDEANRKGEEQATREGERRDRPEGHEGTTGEEGPEGAGDNEDNEAESGSAGLPTLTRSPELASLYAEVAAKRGADGLATLVEIIQGVPDTTLLSDVDSFYRDPKTNAIISEDEYRKKYDIEPTDFPPASRLWHPPKKFDPKFLTPKLKKLLKYWTDVLGFVLLALGEKRPFGVGWYFSFAKRGWPPVVSGALACHYHHEGKDWLLLNPYRGGDIQAAQLYSLRNDEDLKLIHACAMHEVTHFHNGTGDHDEDYAIALTKNIATSMLSIANLRAIRKEAVKREVRPEGWVAPEKPPTKKRIKFNEKTAESINKAVANIKRMGKRESNLWETVYLFRTDGEKESGGAVVMKTRYSGGGRYTGSIVKAFGDVDTLYETTGETHEKVLEDVVDNVRRVIAEKYPQTLAPDVEKPTGDIKEYLNKIKEELVASANKDEYPYAEIADLGGHSVRVLTSYESWNGKWTVKLYIDAARIHIENSGFKAPDLGEADWAKKVVKETIKIITPKISEGLSPIKGSQRLSELREQLIYDLMGDGANGTAETDGYRIDVEFENDPDDRRAGTWKIKTWKDGDLLSTTALYSPSDVPNHWPSGNAERHLVEQVVDKIILEIAPLVTE